MYICIYAYICIHIYIYIMYIHICIYIERERDMRIGQTNSLGTHRINGGSQSFDAPVSFQNYLSSLGNNTRFP